MSRSMPDSYKKMNDFVSKFDGHVKLEAGDGEMAASRKYAKNVVCTTMHILNKRNKNIEKFGGRK